MLHYLADKTLKFYMIFNVYSAQMRCEKIVLVSRTLRLSNYLNLEVHEYMLSHQIPFLVEF